MLALLRTIQIQVVVIPRWPFVQALFRRAVALYCVDRGILRLQLGSWPWFRLANFYTILLLFHVLDEQRALFVIGRQPSNIPVRVLSFLFSLMAFRTIFGRRIRERKGIVVFDHALPSFARHRPLQQLFWFLVVIFLVLIELSCLLIISKVWLRHGRAIKSVDLITIWHKVYLVQLLLGHLDFTHVQSVHNSWHMVGARFERVLVERPTIGVLHQMRLLPLPRFAPLRKGGTGGDALSPVPRYAPI